MGTSDAECRIPSSCSSSHQPAAVELTHNWGTENNPDLKYHSGNEDPRGFGHIGITVPNVYEACERFEKEGVKFRKTPDGGNMKGLVRKSSLFMMHGISCSGSTNVRILECFSSCQKYKDNSGSDEIPRSCLSPSI